MGHYPPFACIMYRDDKALGYTATIQEAEAMCQGDHSLQWDFMTDKRRRRHAGVKQLKALTVNDTKVLTSHPPP